MNSNHPFHLVDKSPWPILASFNAMFLVFGLVEWFLSGATLMMIMAFLNISLVKLQWWRDVIRESTFQGLHTKEVMLGLRWGMILFITSEIFFFLSFFWAFFHMSLSPDINLGVVWPCTGVQSFNPMGIPLLNTIILVSSGLTVTWCHYSLLKGLKMESILSLTFTCILGVYFSIMQVYEYKMASFTISDSVYGSTFFMTTGFHGFHVLVGTLFLISCLVRLTTNHFSSYHHFGFEAAAWYWHFVDVVWLFLYIFMYWWSGIK